CPQFTAHRNASHRQYLTYQGSSEVRLPSRYRFRHIRSWTQDQFCAGSKLGAETKAICDAEKGGSELGACLWVGQCHRPGHEHSWLDAVWRTYVKLRRACAHRNANVTGGKFHARAGCDLAGLFKIGQDCRDPKRNISGFALKQPVPHVSRRPEVDINLLARLAFEFRDEACHHRPRAAGGDDLYFRCLDVGGGKSPNQTNDNACAFHTCSVIAC